MDSLAAFLKKKKNIAIPELEKQLIINPESYGKQYIAALDRRNHKIVYISCFYNPSDHSYRKSERVEVYDGGICYFHLKIDL